jgi:hypothetical protein
LAFQNIPQSIQSARLSFQSSVLGPLTPLTRKGVLLPPPRLGPRGETHLLGGSWEEVRRPNSDEGIDSLVLYVYYNLSTILSFCT